MDVPQNDDLQPNALPASTHSAPENPSPDWRQSKWLAVAELIVVALIFYADFKHHIYFSKTPYLLLFDGSRFACGSCVGATLA